MNSADPPARSTGAWARAWEWLWRGRALAEARAARAGSSQRTLQQGRARIAAEVAQRTLNPSGPWLSGDAHHLAAALFAESIAWSLRAAEQEGGETVAAPAGSTLRPPGPEELKRLVVAHTKLLEDAAGDDQSLQRVLRLMLERDFETAAASVFDMQQAAQELGKVANRLLLRVDGTGAAVDRVLAQRDWRVGGLALLLLAIVPATSRLNSYLEARADVSRGKPWTTSSVYEPVCQSPAHACGQTQGYFFSTKKEDSPWLVIDLTRPEAIRGAHVQNRRDCCPERAVPLVIEVSSDQRNWREVARTNETFDEWKVRFPAVVTRWVRFRIPRQSYLHLYDVRVLR
jgi:hypothetical protein